MGWADRVKQSLRGAVDGSAEEAPSPRPTPVPSPAAESPGAPAELVDALLDQLVKISKGKLKREEVDPSGHIFDYGYVDSLSAVMLIAHVERSYGVQITDVEIVERFNTLDTIAARIHALR